MSRRGKSFDGSHLILRYFIFSCCPRFELFHAARGTFVIERGKARADRENDDGGGKESQTGGGGFVFPGFVPNFFVSFSSLLMLEWSMRKKRGETERETGTC